MHSQSCAQGNGDPRGSHSRQSPTIAHTLSWPFSPNLNLSLSYPTLASLNHSVWGTPRLKGCWVPLGRCQDMGGYQTGSRERAGQDLGPPSLPVGDGDQLRAVVSAQAPGIVVDHLVLSQPVAGWAMPRPTLAQERGQKKGVCGRKIPPLPASA